MGFKRRFDKEFKRAVAEEIITGIISVAAASRKYGIAYQLAKQWQEDYELGRLDNEPTTAAGQMIGRLTMENELLRKL